MFNLQDTSSHSIRATQIIILDWQFLTKGSVFKDIALMACGEEKLDKLAKQISSFDVVSTVSMSPEETEVNLDHFCDVYYETFAEVAGDPGLEVPWAKEEFRRLVWKLSIYFCFVWTIISYCFRCGKCYI